MLSVTVQPPLSDVGTAQNPNLTLPNGSIGNAKLANSSLTVTAGAGLSGGGAVALGGSVAVAMPNVGPNATIAYPASITLDAQGRVSSAIAGSAPPPTANVQLFLAPGTFTKPVGAYQWADLFLIGPGGPGGRVVDRTARGPAVAAAALARIRPCVCHFPTCRHPCLSRQAPWEYQASQSQRTAPTDRRGRRLVRQSLGRSRRRTVAKAVPAARARRRRAVLAAWESSLGAKAAPAPRPSA